MTDGNIFAYSQNGWGSTAGKAEIFTPGSDPKAGTYALTEASRDIHGEEAFVVALPGNKVLVGGGTSDDGSKSRSIEIYDPAAGATIYFVDGPNEQSLSSHGPEGGGDHPSIRAAFHAVELFAENVLFSHTELSALRGKNLCCWCPPDQPCHADVLLVWANS